MTLQSPLTIEVLLHAHAKCDPMPRIDMPAVKEAIKMLLDCGAIQSREGEDTGLYGSTEMGKAWVKALCNVPMPMRKEVWVDEAGRVLT